ncbi:MAG: AI-2E family transporter, partial [Acetobacteraceae bacterium]|nr:AI-2E family transporter [Acetobacteraceae bacterium]
MTNPTDDLRPGHDTARLPGATTLLVLALAVWVLSAGREVLVPLALALLLTIAVMPVVEALQRLRLPRAAAVLVVLVLVIGLIAGVLWTVANQALILAGELPRYEMVLRGKIEALAQGSGPIDALTKMARRLGTAMSAGESEAAPAVAVLAPREGPFETLLGLVHLVLAPLVLVAVTLLMMAFLLMQREDMRDRVLRIAGTQDLHRTTHAMADATARVGRYLLMQLVVNATFGLSMGAGLWLIGLPNAPLWGMLGFVLRFIPYLGAPLSLVFPLLLAFATTEGWATVLLVVALFAVVDIVITYVMEPMLYGHTTGITPFALLLSSIFWTLIWGPVGLILAPAITACIVILGRHVPALEFLALLLGDEEPLPAPARFYQRFLAGDVEGAEALLARHAGEEGLLPALSGLVLPSLARLDEDQRAGVVGGGFALRMARQVARLVVEEAETGPPPPVADVAVLPIGGAVDRAAAEAVRAALNDEGLAAVIGPDVARAAKLSVLVSVAPPVAGRLRRALATAARGPGPVFAFDAGAEAIAAQAAALPDGPP